MTILSTLRKVFFFTVAAFVTGTLEADGTSVDIGTWTAGNGIISNADTSSPWLGNTTVNSNAATTIMYADMGQTTLADAGDMITLSGSMTVTGAVSNQDLAMRFGLFNRNGKTTTLGWLGYTAMTRTNAASPAIFAKNGVDNGVNDFGSSLGGTGGFLNPTGSSLRGALLGNGTYKFSESISLNANGGVTVAMAISGSGELHFSQTTTDPSPNAGTGPIYNAVGFSFSGQYAPDRVTFSNIAVSFLPAGTPAGPMMYFGDTSRLGASRPYSKDPSVVRFLGKYWLYYSIPPNSSAGTTGWGIGIATSRDLINWTVVGSLNQNNTHPDESGGMAAPCAKVINGKIHIFYQSYPGNPARILHAWSTDGINFTRNSGNPIFQAPVNNWSNGRAIDADVFEFNGSLFLYYASRNAANYPTNGTSSGTVQLLGVASTPMQENSDYDHATWTNLNNSVSILEPNQSTWEQRCIEASTVVRRGDTLYMFYAGGFNNDPQQIGVATSSDGVNWTRLPSLNGQPFLANGTAGAWNSSESGHPGVFVDEDGEMYLFFQGNKDNGNTWYLSWKKLTWNANEPALSNGTWIEAWRRKNFNTALAIGPSDDMADPDADRVFNLVEYAVGGNPNMPDIYAPAVLDPLDGESDRLSLTFTRMRDAADVTYRVLGTSNLTGTWTEIWSSASHPFSGSAESQSVTVLDTETISSSPARFLRLETTVP